MAYGKGFVVWQGINLVQFMLKVHFDSKYGKGY